MTKRDKLLILAIIAVVALVAAHAFLSVDFVKAGKSVISRVELKNLEKNYHSTCRYCCGSINSRRLLLLFV